MARRAQNDLASAARWYKQQRVELGEEFLEEIQTALDRATANPFSFQPIPRTQGVRRVLTRRFPYRVFFTIRDSEIVVFRVLHSSRHDREWKKNTPRPE